MRAKEEALTEINELISASKKYWNDSAEYLSQAIPLLMRSAEYLQENLCFQIMTDDEEICGFFSFNEDGAKHTLDHLWIKPNFIGKGLGRLAINFARELGTKKHWDSILVLPEPGSLEFYKKMGFVETGIQRESRVVGGPTFKVLRMDISAPSSAVYSPDFFREDNLELLLKVIKENSFATLMTANSSANISHLPFIVSRVNDQDIELVCHMAKANPHWEELALAGKAKVIFGGPHAYISPAWYSPKLSNVPTWNYAVVHASGDFKIVSDMSEATNLMDALINEFESSYGTNWSLPIDRTATLPMMDHIVVFKIVNIKWEAKFKLSQQQDSFNREAVIEQLKKYGHEDLSVLMEMTRKGEVK